MNRVYQLITDRIIALLKQGTAPWQKPWNGEAFAPRNLVSRRPYRGINALLLSCTEYASPFWLTFRQARELGGSVKKGEHSTPIIFWKWQEKENPRTGRIDHMPLLGYYRVFHVSQCDLPADKIPDLPGAKPDEFSSIEVCEQVVANMPHRPAIEHDSRAAFYLPSRDTIHLPKPHCFEKPHLYFGTLYHELIHATGHFSRLDRPGHHRHPSFWYAYVQQGGIDC